MTLLKISNPYLKKKPVRNLLFIDNFDSFTYNLVDYFHQLHVRCSIVRNDVALDHLDKLEFDGIVISPGPGAPEEAGITLSVIEKYAADTPILGICLGHQAIGQFFGSRLTQASQPMHGKMSEIEHFDNPLFKNLPKTFKIVRYHSLILTDIGADLKVTAQTKNKEVMAIQHKKYPVTGLQFHPEAYLSENGIQILKNWIGMYL